MLKKTYAGMQAKVQYNQNNDSSWVGGAKMEGKIKQGNKWGKIGLNGVMSSVDYPYNKPKER